MSTISLTASQSAGNINQLAKTVKTLAILSSSISHELKNNLAAINLCVRLAENQLNNAKQSANAANYLLSNLQLQIKEVIAGKLSKDDFKLYSITKNIEEALEQYFFQGSERSLITVEPSQDFRYIGNPSLTNHILYNLIKNSLRAIRNSNKGTITIRLEPGNPNKLIFRDTANGIPKDFLPKIFELFESQSTQNGTGVGLAFCKETMQSYGGDITCKSMEGEYTEFTVTFPLP